jgi:ribosome-associated translation inhibitor RaiA
MNLPMQITFRNIPSSPAVEDWIRTEAAKLETFYRGPVGCRVVVELPHRHHRKGGLYHICIDLALPGGEVVVTRAPNLGKRLWQTGEVTVRKYLELEREHKNLHRAINDAFKAAARRLRDYACWRRGDVKTHSCSRLRRLRKAFRSAPVV